MALPLSLVDMIHARLAVRYGSAWMAKWSGIDPRLVKADWANELDGMDDAAIQRAMQSLPDEFPPTASAFRALGEDKGMPRPELLPPALPAPLSPNLASMAAKVRAHFGIRRKTTPDDGQEAAA